MPFKLWDERTYDFENLYLGQLDSICYKLN